MNIAIYLPSNVATEYGNEYQVPMHKYSQKYADYHSQPERLTEIAGKQLVEEFVRGIHL